MSRSPPENVINSIPVAGHIKDRRSIHFIQHRCSASYCAGNPALAIDYNPSLALAHYMRNESEEAGAALMAANRTTLVIAGAALGGRYLGPSGINLGSILGGLTADSVHTVVMKSPQGNFLLIVEVLENPRVEKIWKLVESICMDVGVGQQFGTPLRKLIERGAEETWLCVKSMTIKEIANELRPYAVHGLVLCVTLYVNRNSSDSDLVPRENALRNVASSANASSTREANFNFRCVCFDQGRECRHFSYAMRQYLDEFETGLLSID